jgi:hypothetical protein
MKTITPTVQSIKAVVTPYKLRKGPFHTITFFLGGGGWSTLAAVEWKKSFLSLGGVPTYRLRLFTGDTLLYSKINTTQNSEVVEHVEVQ